MTAEAFESVADACAMRAQSAAWFALTATFSAIAFRKICEVSHMLNCNSCLAEL